MQQFILYENVSREKISKKNHQGDLSRGMKFKLLFHVSKRETLNRKTDSDIFRMKKKFKRQYQPIQHSPDNWRNVSLFIASETKSE